MNGLPGDELPVPIPPRRTSMDTHSTRSNISKVRDRERDTQKTRIGKASKESLVLLALEREENRKLLSALEDYQKSNLELLNRAQQAEADLVAATSRIVQVHNNRVKLNEDVDRANALIQQYRVQLEAAQEEIRKADQAIQRLDQLRRKEKERADKYKEALQKMNEAVALQSAREEGRIAGFREGLRQGQMDAEARYSIALDSRISAIEDNDRQSPNQSSSHRDSDFSDSQEGPIPPSTQAESPPVQARMSPPQIADTTQYRPPSPPPPVIPPPPPAIPPPPPVIPPPPPPPTVSSPPLPIPAPTRNLNSNEPIRPVMTHQHPNFQSPPPPQEPIPPEGFIPRADPDTRHIPLPHQHELSRQHYMTQIPQPISFPEPEPALSFPEPDPRIIPPPGSYRNATVNMMTEQQYRAAQSSPESASTVISLAQMELVNSNPNLRRTQSPMSTILEAPSGQATPNVVEEHVLSRKSSMRSVSSSGHRPYTPSNHVPSNWGRMSTDEDEEPARVMTPSNSSTRSMGRKSSVKSLGSSRRGYTGNDPSVPQLEPYTPYTYPTAPSSARGDPRRDTTTPHVATRAPYTYPTPPPLAQRNPRSDTATPPVAKTPYTYPTPPPNTRGSSRRDTSTPPVNRSSHGRPTPPPPPQLYGIYAPPRTMGDIREEEERLTPTLPANRPLSPQQTRLRSPRPDAQDLHVDLPHPPYTASSLADDMPTPSSLSIGIDVVSPTPPGSSYGEHEPNQTIREFLSPQDVQSRPLPPDTHTERSTTQTVPPPLSMTASSPQIQALPDGGFFVPMTFTPKPTTDDTPLPSSPGPGIFVPQKFTPTAPPQDLVSSPRPTSSRPTLSRPSSPSSSNMPGGFTDLNTPAEEPPVIPPANLLRAAQNISDSDDESGMNSEANTLTTPPSKTKGLPSQRGGASTRGATPTTRARGGGGKKKKR